MLTERELLRPALTSGVGFEPDEAAPALDSLSSSLNALMMSSPLNVGSGVTDSSMTSSQT